MDQALWNLYLNLQSSMTLEGGIASEPGESIMEGSPATLGTLLIGPSRLEVETLRLHGKPTTVLSLRVEDDPKVNDDPLLNFVVGDMHDMPFPTGSFERILASNVMEHCLSPYIALMECRRVVVKEGTTTFVVPSFAGREGGVGPFHLHCLDENVWIELLRKTGFAITHKRVEIGFEDPSASYYCFTCEAVDLPFPHDHVLRRLIAFKRG